MKKTLSSLLVLAALACALPLSAGAAIDADASYSAFYSINDASFDGWTGVSATSDSAISADNWFTFYSSSRCVGHVMSNYYETYAGATSPTATILYNAQNFGSEYSFRGSAYIFQNQIYIYFNTAATFQSKKITVNSGYRFEISRSARTLKLQKCVASTWIDLSSISLGSESMPYSPLDFSLDFADGQIDFSMSASAAYSFAISCDVSGDANYYPAGYIGFGSAATRMLANNIRVDYNSGKVYDPPKMAACSDVFRGFTVLPYGSDAAFSAELEFGDAADVARAELYLDNVLHGDLTLSGNAVSASVSSLAKGVHTAAIRITDKYASESEICRGTFFVADHYASPCVFTNAAGEKVAGIADIEGENVTATFDFNKKNSAINTLTAMILVYDAEKNLSGVDYRTVSALPDDTELDISVTTGREGGIPAGYSVSAFLCADISDSAPLSGSFELN